VARDRRHGGAALPSCARWKLGADARSDLSRDGGTCGHVEQLKRERGGGSAFEDLIISQSSV
jgi:hypothetical protein